MAWRLEMTKVYEREQKKHVGKDGNLRNRVKKKVSKILDDPERVGDPKTGALVGLRAEYVGHHVILFEVVREGDNPPGKVVLRYFWHHNDPKYDP